MNFVSKGLSMKTVSICFFGLLFSLSAIACGSAEDASSAPQATPNAPATLAAQAHNGNGGYGEPCDPNFPNCDIGLVCDRGPNDEFICKGPFGR